MGTDTSRTQCLRPMGTAKPSPYKLGSELANLSSHVVQTLVVCARTRNCSFFLPNIYNDLHICNLRLFPYTDFLANSSSCAVCNKLAEVSRLLPKRSPLHQKMHRHSPPDPISSGCVSVYLHSFYSPAALRRFSEPTQNRKL